MDMGFHIVAVKVYCHEINYPLHAVMVVEKQCTHITGYHMYVVQTTSINCFNLVRIDSVYVELMEHTSERPKEQ